MAVEVKFHSADLNWVDPLQFDADERMPLQLSILHRDQLPS